jgi:futalosine hydrolase
LGDFGICDETAIVSLRSDTLEILDTFALNGPLLSEAASVLAGGGMACRRGTFVTVSCVSGTSRRGDLLARQHQGLCENMEGAAAARVCREFGLPLLEMRCVSNLVEERDLRKWRLREACDRCGEAAALLLQGLPHD